jgi:hypothetical protein
LKQRCFHAERLMHMWRLEMASGARLALQRWPFCGVFSHPNHEISMVMYICHLQILENKKNFVFEHIEYDNIILFSNFLDDVNDNPVLVGS